jgi:hypothetical protein
VYRRLGFTLTERGSHSLGSMNHLAIFGTDYLELIAVPKNAPSNRLDLLKFPLGLNRLVFGREDSAVTYDALGKASVPVELPSPISSTIATLAAADRVAGAVAKAMAERCPRQLR